MAGNWGISMKYRDRLQIIADILSIVSVQGVKKTHVMYQGNLSFKQVSKYLEDLLEAKLITCNSSLYEITDRGLDFLAKYAEYLRLRNDLENLLSLINRKKTVLEQELHG